MDTDKFIKKKKYLIENFKNSGTKLRLAQ